jgi:hypothetical protein
MAQLQGTRSSVIQIKSNVIQYPFGWDYSSRIGAMLWGVVLQTLAPSGV